MQNKPAESAKTVLILGANSDVAKECMRLYVKGGYFVLAASRNLEQLQQFINREQLPAQQIEVLYFDAEDFSSHQSFYYGLARKPNIVVYAAGFLVTNDQALHDFPAAHKMMQVNYAGAVSILNQVATDTQNIHLERIIGLSSLSGVRGRKSNFIYGSTKSAFTQYLAGLRQLLNARGVVVNVVTSGYINTKINAGLKLNKHLLMEPAFVAKHIIKANHRFEIVPGWKWKIIHRLLKWMPEWAVAMLP